MKTSKKKLHKKIKEDSYAIFYEMYIKKLFLHPRRTIISI